MTVSACLLRHPHPEDRLAALRQQMAAADRAAARRKWVHGPIGSGHVLRGLAVAAVLVLAMAAILPLLTEGGAPRESANDVWQAGATLRNGPVSERVRLIVDNLDEETRAVQAASPEPVGTPSAAAERPAERHE
jgi:hypothetical protein